MRPFVRTCVMGCWLALAGALAHACAICAPSDAYNTVLHRLFTADGVALARPDADGSSYQLIQLVKGTSAERNVPVARWWSAEPPRDSAAPVLLLYSAAAQQWRGAGRLGLQRAEWLRRVVAMQPITLPAQVDWPARLAFFVADLEDPEPLVAQAAYEEISVAPYTAMRSLKPRLSSARIASWLGDPKLVARLPLYTLLWGVVGGAHDALVLEKRLQIPNAAADGPRLAAALVAYMEMRGASALPWMEREYLANKARSEAEVQAAVVALGVHGNDGVRVPRERIVSAYATLTNGNRAMAGFAASDLAAWGHWEFGSAYADILKSSEPVTFASRYAMVFYLLRSPRPDARSALESLRAAKVL